MQIVDLTYLMNIHTPGWVGHAGNKMYFGSRPGGANPLVGHDGR
jgi:hypothetical protein